MTDQIRYFWCSKKIPEWWCVVVTITLAIAGFVGMLMLVVVAEVNNKIFGYETTTNILMPCLLAFVLGASSGIIQYELWWERYVLPFKHDC